MKEMELETERIRSGNYDKSLAEYSYNKGWDAALDAAKLRIMRTWDMQDTYLPIHFMDLLDEVKAFEEDT